MTNEDKLREIFPKTIFIYRKEDDKTSAIQCSDEWLNAEYKEPTTKNDLAVPSGLAKNSKKLEKDFGELDCIDRQAAITFVCKNTKEILKDTMSLKVKLSDNYLYENVAKIMRNPKVLPSVTPQEPKTGNCRDCKWWKDSDGAYRRGIGAESKCPMNRKEVYEGNGYCFLFEPQEREDKE